MPGCSKENMEGNNTLPYITFGVSGLDIETKSLITSSNITSQNVYVYGVRNNTEKIFNKTPITKNQNNENWETATKKQWAAGSSYSFYAYTSSPDALNSAPSSGNSGVYVENDGLKITVVQPNSYNTGNMVDYMLSHAYKVADGSNYHTVMLNMQHAMSWVEIIIEKEQPSHNIKLNSITLSGFFRTATMQCESQATANSGADNLWTISLSGENNTQYTIGPFDPPTGEEKTLGSMSLLAVPQQLREAATIEVSYTITEYDEAIKNYTPSFKLFNYTPYVWTAGHKITYTLSINTGVSLKAHISDWIDAGYTEGIILPSNKNSGGA